MISRPPAIAIATWHIGCSGRVTRFAGRENALLERGHIMSEHKSNQHSQDSNNNHGAPHSESSDKKQSDLASSDAHEPKPMPEALKDLAGGIVNQAKHIAETKVDGQKAKVADSLGDVAHALRQATSARHEPVIDTVRPYVEKAADQVERVSGYVQNATLRDMANDLERFARREPALFLGGAFALGLIGGRFLKSGTPKSDSQGSGASASSGSSSVAHTNNQSNNNQSNHNQSSNNQSSNNQSSNNHGSKKDHHQNGGQQHAEPSNASSKQAHQREPQKGSATREAGSSAKQDGGDDAPKKASEQTDGGGAKTAAVNDPATLVRDFSASSKGNEVKANGQRE